MYGKKSLSNKILLLSLALIITISGLGFVTRPAFAGACVQTHVVQKGEYLSQIARKYSVDWRTLADINNLKDPSVIYPGQKLCISTSGVILPDTGSNNKTPSIVAVSAVKDKKVTIHATNFPANVTFNILMGKGGTQAKNGYLMGTVVSDKDGDFYETVDIHPKLKGEATIAIRLEGKSWFAYNWFNNRTFENASGGGVTPVFEDDEELPVTVQNVKFGDRADVYRGNAGLFTPRSNYTGVLRVVRYWLNESVAQRGLFFEDSLLEVGFYDSKGKLFKDVYGLNYVYFNLNRDTRKAYDADKLNIYFYNENSKRWEACDIQMLITTKNKPNGRIACIAEDFGLYGLASTR